MQDDSDQHPEPQVSPRHSARVIEEPFLRAVSERKTVWRRALLGSRKARMLRENAFVGQGDGPEERLASRLQPLISGGIKGVLAGFVPLPSEPDIWPFLRVLKNLGWIVLVPDYPGPRSPVSQMRLGPTISRSGESAVEPSWNYLGGGAAIRADLERTTHILMPGVAFDLLGNRLGRGGGWYDRALNNLPEEARRVAIAFENEVFEPGFLPVEEHDQMVDFIVTPQATYGPFQRR